MKVLYVSDLDGTLLNENSSISEQSLSILNTLIKKRGSIYVCHGTILTFSSQGHKRLTAETSTNCI